MRQILPHIILLLLCIASRLLTSIYYIEDPDSMRFALSVLEYDISKFQPHFPGYPVFCFLVKCIYAVTGSFSSAFALTGGISVYLIILFSCRILRVPLVSLEGLLLSFILFFNPFIWLMSNRFMPDLAGTAAALAAFHFFVTGDFKPSNVRFGWLALGLLAGIRLSYLPLLLIPAAFAFFKRKWTASFWLVPGILAWFIPMIMVTGWDNLAQAALFQTNGHFNDFGGTVLTEPDYLQRFWNFMQFVWADGLGGGWPDRYWLLWILSAGIALCLVAGSYIFIDFDYPKEKMLIALASLLLYSLWIFCFQNIYYHPRHALPLLPFLCMILSYGVIFYLINFNNIPVKATILVFLAGLAIQGTYTAWSHKKPTAIAQIKAQVEKEKKDSLYIVTHRLIKEYLIIQKVKASFIIAEEEPEKLKELKGKKVITIGQFGNIFGSDARQHKKFIHDPYVNRTWPQIEIYSNFEWQEEKK